MELKYDIYMLNNAQGTGEKRQYVRIVQHEPMTEKQLQEKIQSRCSLTKGDVAAVLAELHDLLVEEFSMGRRFYIPEIGYFSMSASQRRIQTRRLRARKYASPASTSDQKVS